MKKLDIYFKNRPDKFFVLHIIGTPQVIKSFEIYLSTCVPYTILYFCRF